MLDNSVTIHCAPTGLEVGSRFCEATLGLTFSSTCTWTEHVNNISLKAWTNLYLLRILKFRVSRKSLEKSCISFVRPLLEYSVSIWDNCSSDLKKQLEAIHKEAERIVSGAIKLCSIEKPFVELGWKSFQSRRNKHKLTRKPVFGSLRTTKAQTSLRIRAV